MKKNIFNPSLPHSSEELLNKEKAKNFWEFIDNNPATLFVNDAETFETIWINKIAAEKVGITKEERYAMGFDFARQNYHTEDMNILKEAVDKLKFNDGPFDAVYRLKHKNGNWFWVYSIVKVLKRNTDGSPKLISGAGFMFDKPIYTDDKMEILLKENHMLRNQLKINKLTKREKEIIKHIADGKIDKEIAAMLNVSFHTIRTHRKNVYSKLMIDSTADLVRFAFDSGLN